MRVALGEPLVALLARLRRGRPVDPRHPRSILVLRNNDLGDLLVITPLFAALRRLFPATHLVAAVGSWGLPVLQGNPHLSETMVVEAPWFNKFVPHQSTLARLRFVLASRAARELRERRFEVGIDVVGSLWGSLLLLSAGIPLRLGVRGYAGGHSAAWRTVRFDPFEQVGRSALRFAELLGARPEDLPPVRPQLFLSPVERSAGEAAWQALSAAGQRVLVGPGAGLALKSWPVASYRQLVAALAGREGLALAIAGGPGERELGEELAGLGGNVRNYAGVLSMRETFALAAGADLVIANSSMLMHAAAAFSRPTLVLLGPAFPSARQHDAQWGYPGTCRSLGRETGERAEAATPEEALGAVLEELARLEGGGPRCA
ncbi:MAG TPA: glycosyltransferase family 9 protein [Thermoanaerobaculia bacterium]|nr:glycosyltransferase family 9 protein [Thermoanaerobaculia bacterium]